MKNGKHVYCRTADQAYNQSKDSGDKNRQMRNRKANTLGTLPLLQMENNFYSELQHFIA